MRSAKETGCFPYRMKTVCYFEVFPNGETVQLSRNKGDRSRAYFNAKAGVSKLCAVWPGQWWSDLFIIDDLEAFAEELELFYTNSRRQVDYGKV